MSELPGNPEGSSKQPEDKNNSPGKFSSPKAKAAPRTENEVEDENGVPQAQRHAEIIWKELMAHGEITQSRLREVFVIKRLRNNGDITEEEFQSTCGPQADPKKARELGKKWKLKKADFLSLIDDKRLIPNVEWHRTTHAMAVVLRELGCEASFSGGVFKLPSGLDGLRGSRAFPPSRDDVEKEYIGHMVAQFLQDTAVCDEKASVFLGSGSTIYHVGLQMLARCNDPEKKTVYKQLFATINIPLAERWCGREHPPSNKLSIPRGVLETRESRLETLQGDLKEEQRWEPSIAIVGVDGVRYDRNKGEAWLYAKSESIAYNTNLFVQSASSIVLYCLAVKKMSGDNNGPRLKPPPKHVVQVIVTNKGMPYDIKNALAKKYIIVEEYSEFTGLKEKWKDIEK